MIEIMVIEVEDCSLEVKMSACIDKCSLEMRPGEYENKYMLAFLKDMLAVH